MYCEMFNLFFAIAKEQLLRQEKLIRTNSCIANWILEEYNHLLSLKMI